MTTQVALTEHSASAGIRRRLKRPLRALAGLIACAGTRHRLGPLLLALAVVALWFGFLEVRGLYFPDEGRYAEIPREMLATGDWVTPRLNGIPYFEKPPLQYWVTAAVFAAAGEDEWTTRLWPAFAGLAAVVAVLLTVRRIFSRRAGWVAAAVMASCWGYFFGTQFVTLDMTLSAFMTGALCAFLVAQDARSSDREQRNYMAAAWLLAGLAVLAKGLVGFVLPLLAIGLYAVVTRDASLLRRLHLRVGVPLFAAVTVPWFALVEARNPGFADFFFIQEHVLRYLRPEHRRTGPWWYFVPLAIGFLMPWFPAIVSTVAHRSRTVPATRAFDAGRFAWCSAAAIFVFFSLSSSKLPGYIMPAVGAVAIASAAPLARRMLSTLRLTAWTLAACGVVSVAAAYPVARLVKVPMVRAGLEGGEGWVVAGALVFVAAAVAALALCKRRRPLRALAVLAVASMIACQFGGMIATRVDSYFSSEYLIERVLASERGRPGASDIPFYSVDMFDQTVPFYLGRTVTLVREQGEIARGLALDPENYIPTVEEFARRWRSGGEAYAIMERDVHDKLVREGLPMREVDSDGRRFVVARR